MPPTVAIMSLGEMGVGIALLLKAHSIPVITNLSGRSEATRARAAAAGITSVSSGIGIANADIILSIVPPAEALPTAQQIIRAYTSAARSSKTPQYYIDLNATSRSTAENIAALFQSSVPDGPHFLDGAIFGHPPSQLPDGSGWKRPRIAVSGCWKLDPLIMSILNIRSVGDEIGQASTLKMCFASLTKGLTALAVQSFATASRMDMLAELREEVAAFAPGWVEYLERSLGLVPGKAYRWVTEMENIKDTHRETGFEEDVFRGVAEVYRFVSEETVLGKGRVWGRSADEVVRDVEGSLKKKRGLEEVEDVEDSGGNSEKRARIDGEEVETS